MKAVDIILAAGCAVTIAFLANDFLTLPAYQMALVWVVLPVIAVFFLWLSEYIGKKLFFVFQSAKHVLVGGAATVIDLKIFEFLLPIFFLANPLILKSASFLFSTALKYAGNKYWAFEKNGGEDIHKEVGKFFFITIVGLLIDVCVFYYATKVVGPQFGILTAIWIKLSVILAALAAAVWNFLGYKFLVFKK